MIILCRISMLSSLPIVLISIKNVTAGNCNNNLQQLCDLRVVDGKNEVKTSRSSMLWNSFEGYKRDLSTLSEQDEDFLYRNSNMLAAFEIEGW